MAQDVRFALRGFRRSPGFALTVSRHAGPGAGNAGDRIQRVQRAGAAALRGEGPVLAVRAPGLGRDEGPIPDAAVQLAARSRISASGTGRFPMFWVSPTCLSLRGLQRSVQAVTGNYFTMLGGRICMGRPILESDDVPGDGVAVASYAAWKGVLGADPGAVGRTVRLGDKLIEVVGVACPEFNGLEERRIDFWVSLPLSGAFDFSQRTEPAPLSVVGRLRPGMTREGAEAALAAYGRQVYPTWRYGKRPESATLQPSASVYPLNRDSIRLFLPVFAAFGLILLIACANVSNMMLARGLAACVADRCLLLCAGSGRCAVTGMVLKQVFTAGSSRAVLLHEAARCFRSALGVRVPRRTGFTAAPLACPACGSAEDLRPTPGGNAAFRGLFGGQRAVQAHSPHSGKRR